MASRDRSSKLPTGGEGRAKAVALDGADPLASFRQKFTIPANTIYLDGNSLGLLPKRAAARSRQTVEDEWGGSAICGWNDHGWIDLPLRVGARIAKLIGAKNDEVVAGETTSVNLFKCLTAALAMRPGRKTVITSKSNFPTDMYITQGLARTFGVDVRYVEPPELSDALNESVAAVTFSHVNYKTARIEDMAGVTARAHESGALVVWDLCHSAGALPVKLNEANADFAVGCGYKYLNGGPGAPAFLFAARRHHADIRQPLSGWMGHASPFEFDGTYRPAQGIRRMLTGTPPVVALSVLDESVALIQEAGIERLRTKSKTMITLLVDLISHECEGHGLRFGSPNNEEIRGSHVIYHHPHGYAIVQALKTRGVVGDFRSPDCIRLGIAPIYLSYENIWDAVQHFRQVMLNREWECEAFQTRATVT